MCEDRHWGRGLHSVNSELNLRTFRYTSLTSELNWSTSRTHPRVIGLFGGQRELKLSGKGPSELKLSGDGNECKPPCPSVDLHALLRQVVKHRRAGRECGLRAGALHTSPTQVNSRTGDRSTHIQVTGQLTISRRRQRGKDRGPVLSRRGS